MNLPITRSLLLSHSDEQRRGEKSHTPLSAVMNQNFACFVFQQSGISPSQMKNFGQFAVWSILLCMPSTHSADAKKDNSSIVYLRDLNKGMREIQTTPVLFYL